MATINLSLALDLIAIKNSNKLTDTIDNAEKRIISNEYIHMLDLRGTSFKDEPGGVAEIYNVKMDDTINWHLDNYSSYNSDLSAMIINYVSDDNNSKDFLTPPKIIRNSLKRPYYTADFDVLFKDVDLYYWTSDVLKLNVTAKYKGLIRVYEKDQPLGYAYIERSITLRP
ncbi:hypothetical protein [Xenorhabdus bovienii]|uniref:hypothetical protein n=1 Tax=Xenorhabdus bovienii TaxID=40576 RepID=UPI00237C8B83|nr:hypothetical protein [Xenorhabdus bovienii]MDE1484576.1 hypothetical protein [Xenorhabdus bovienii]MDE9443845.1 hypothetical protein [Xenorhabdus bovienii]